MITSEPQQSRDDHPCFNPMAYAKCETLIANYPTEKNLPHSLKMYMFGYALIAVGHICLADLVSKTLAQEISIPEFKDSFIIDQRGGYPTVNYSILERYGLLIPPDSFLYAIRGRSQGITILFHDYLSFVPEEGLLGSLDSREVSRLLYDMDGKAPEILLTEQMQSVLHAFGVAMWQAVVENFRSRINANDDWGKDLNVTANEDIMLGEAMIAYYESFINVGNQRT